MTPLAAMQVLDTYFIVNPPVHLERPAVIEEALDALRLLVVKTGEV